MADIAQLGFSVDSADLKDAKASLDAIVPAAGRAEKAADNVAKTLNETAGAADRAAADIREAGTAAGSAAAGFNNLKGATLGAVTGLGSFNSHVDAWHAANGRIKDGLKQTSAQLKFTATDGLNFSRQMADIGVTAAMGMSPLMIALQQGPQLFDILQTRAGAAGVTIGAAFKAAGVAIWTALAPLMPFILGIAAVVGTVAAAFGLATREINKGNDSVIDGLGLTEKQLERVKKSGVDTGVTIGDTFTAFFEVVGDRLYDAFEGPLSWLRDTWSTTLDFITKYGAKAIEFIIGGFIGAVYAIQRGWKLLPGAIMDSVTIAANATIRGIEWMVQKAIDGLNVLIGFANKAAEKVGLSGLGTIGDVGNLGSYKNPYAGQAKALGSAVSDGMNQGLKEARGSVGRFFADVGKKARENARDRIKAVAGDPGAAGGGTKGAGGKSDADKFAEIVEGAQADIAAQKAREFAASLNLVGEALTKYEYETKLLAEAKSKDIKLTAAQRDKIDELANAYARAKTAADDAVGLNKVMTAAKADIDNIKQQADLIGLYGRQLAYATQMQKLLNEAKAQGMSADAIAAAKPQFEAKANEYADASAGKDSKDFMEGVRRSSEERRVALEQEYKALFMGAEEARRYRIENELLAQARQKNIDLTPAEVAAIGKVAAEQAEAEAAIERTRERLQFARDTAKGFFKDFTDGLRNGEGLWKSFADAAENALNRILDKLLDQAFEMALDGIMKVIGSLIGAPGGGFAKGGIFDGYMLPGGGIGGGLPGVGEFASGGAFTNGVVNRPTAFAFGQGKLGVMGEAGPEAVMPLQRGPDGALGVQMYGEQSGGTVINAPITVQNDNRVSGAVSSKDIVEMQRRAAVETENNIKRNLQIYLDQWQRDGTML